MPYETLLNNTYSPVCVKKTYTPSKAVRKILKMACKLLKTSSTTSKGHRELKKTPTPLSCHEHSYLAKKNYRTPKMKSGKQRRQRNFCNCDRRRGSS